MKQPWIFSPAFDLPAIIFPWAITFVALSLYPGLSPHSPHFAVLFTYAVALIFCHRGLTFLIIAGDPPLFRYRQRRFVLTAATMVAVLFAAKLWAAPLYHWLVALVVPAHIWHSNMQRHGFFRDYGRRIGHVSRFDSHLDLLFLWSVSLGCFLESISRYPFQIASLQFYPTIWNEVAAWTVWPGHIFSVVAVGVAIAWLAIEFKTPGSLKLRLPRLCFFISTLGLMLLFVWKGPLVGVVVYLISHALEYIAFVHRKATVRFRRTPPETAIGLLFRHPWVALLVLQGAQLILSAQIPSLISRYTLLGPTVMAVVYLHFLFDQWIWKRDSPWMQVSC